MTKTLKEILAERKRAQQTPVQPTDESAPSAEESQHSEPACVYHAPLSDYQALFAGCTDF